MLPYQRDQIRLPRRTHAHTQRISSQNPQSKILEAMLLNKALRLMVVIAVAYWEIQTEAATRAAVKFCGRQLGEIMSRVCHAYNSPSWDAPTVVEQHGAAVRKKRQLGIADECCVIGCTWEQLSEYCSISAYSESPLAELEAHMIADRSAEESGVTEAARREAPAAVRRRHEGAGRGAGGARSAGRRCRCRCRCRRRRRSGRLRTSLMGYHKKCSSRCTRGGHRVTANNVGQDAQH